MNRLTIIALSAAIAACSSNPPSGTVEVAGDPTGEGTSVPVRHMTFDDGHAISRPAGDMVATELWSQDDTLLATAEWDVTARSGVVTIVDGGAQFPVTLSRETRLDFATANGATHDVWQRETGHEAAYDTSCTWVGIGECGCCGYFSCSNCEWLDLGSPIGWVYDCIVVANSGISCDPNCRCADDGGGGECGGQSCGCGSCCGSSCCI